MTGSTQKSKGEERGKDAVRNEERWAVTVTVFVGKL